MRLSLAGVVTFQEAFIRLFQFCPTNLSHAGDGSFVPWDVSFEERLGEVLPGWGTWRGVSPRLKVTSRGSTMPGRVVIWLLWQVAGWDDKVKP